MRFIYFVLTFLFFGQACAFAQDQEVTKKNKMGFVFSPGITTQKNLFMDVNLLYGIVVNESVKVPVLYYRGFRAGFESNFSTNNYTFAPKIGYEYTPELLTARLSAVNYFQNNRSEFRILPEVGISFFTFINFTYGYGIPLKDKNLRNVGSHRFTLTINLNRRLNGSL